MFPDALPVSVAPMMDWTDRHCRYFLRLVAPGVRLYTEMITAPALLHGDAGRLLAFSHEEHPLALQLGGSEPRELADCARLAAQAGYDELNLNVGCPSDRVRSGRFGACLMLEPARVADCVLAMREAVSLPVSVKCRTGVDERDSYGELAAFVERLAGAGLEHLVVHARKAWLRGLSPKQNREIPPLDHASVYRLKQDFPDLRVTVNGGIARAEEVPEHLEHVDAVMLGRAAYHDPWVLADIESLLADGDGRCDRSRHGVARAMLPYIERELSQGLRLQQIARHMLGLFQGQPGARAWRRHLSENAPRAGAGPEVVEKALECVPESAGVQPAASSVA